jgi:hypothetical protein
LILIKRCAVVAALGAALTGCTSGQSAVEPSFTPVNLASTTTLQFAVGTANLNGGASTGLNTVVTFRQTANGLDATLLNLPTIVGPAGFVNSQTAANAGTDAGTNLISSPAAFPVAGTASTLTTFAPAGTPSGGAFSYGFAPDNSTTSGAAVFTQYKEPFFAKSQTVAGGPPLFPFVRDGTFPTGFVGYAPGFTAFDGVTIAAGTYTLNVNVPSANVAGTNVSAVGHLTSVALLPAIPALAGGVQPLPVAPAVITQACTRTGANGVSFTAVIPAGLTEAIAYIDDITTGSFYSIRTTAVGAVTFTVPDGLGPHGFGQAAAPSVNAAATPGTGDTVQFIVAGFDYAAFEAGPPGNTSATPTIVGANGQADITMSPAATCKV